MDITCYNIPNSCQWLIDQKDIIKQYLLDNNKKRCHFNTFKYYKPHYIERRSYLSHMDCDFVSFEYKWINP